MYVTEIEALVLLVSVPVKLLKLDAPASPVIPATPAGGDQLYKVPVGTMQTE